MSQLRRQAALARAVAGARGPRPQRWGQDIVVGAQVTSFGRHGVGQPAVDGEVVEVQNHGVAIVQTFDGRRVNRSTRNLKRVDR